MKNKLLFLSCIAVISLNLVACSDNNTDSSSFNDSSIDTTTSIVTSDIIDDPSEPITENTTEINSEETITINNVLVKTLENFNNTKSYKMDAEINMSASLDVTADEEFESQHMSVNCLINSLSNDAGIYTKTTMTSDEGEGPEINTEEKYTVFTTKLQYTSTDGKTWYEDEIVENNLVDLDNLFTSNFENATMDNIDNNYIITVDINDIDSFSTSLTEDLEGMDFNGSMVITINDQFYPVCIELTDVKFDTATMEEMLSSTAIEESSAQQSVDFNVDVNIDFNLKIEYSDWNLITNSQILPSDEITSNSISLIEKETMYQEVEIGG